jgi:hypothetical protein
MKRDQILSTIRGLAASQGFYGRLYTGIMEARDNDFDAYDDYMCMLESKNFKDALDLIWFFEC